MTFTPFDPLQSKNTSINNAAFGALKREIDNILSSYVGWYDPFCELIQNALDAVEARTQQEMSAGASASYKPTISIIIDLDQNALTVSDNGIGLNKEQFEQFLAPSFSFKTGNTRGHKGVGATYVAYGFNYMRVSTKTPGFDASGRIVGARNWLKSKSSASNPKVEPDNSVQVDDIFVTFDRGVSITVRFDADTHPKDLKWVGAQTADKWHQILTIKTGLGSIIEDGTVDTSIKVILGNKDTKSSRVGTKYLWLHDTASKKASYKELVKAADALYKKFGAGRKLPDKYNNLDFIYETWTADEVKELLKAGLDPEELDVIQKHAPSVSVEFGYTAKLWNSFNDSMKLRSGYKILASGIQLAANNMPQGEVIQVPLNRNIGRQNQVHFLFHFNDYTPDLGRKGFHRELTDFSKSIARNLMENHLSRHREQLKANTGVSPDLVREIRISDWKKQMVAHESEAPLQLTNAHFFKPVERVSITSTPTREQDVIALFHQLIAGGVIRGLNILSTNEWFTYDGLFRIALDLEKILYVYDAERNPLGVPENVADALHGKITEPRVLEYKFCLDGLIEDFDAHDKNLKDVDLCIVWSTGTAYESKYGITSLITPENADQRQYHGVTHVLSDLETGAKHCELVVLEELVEYLNDPEAAAILQRVKYE